MVLVAVTVALALLGALVAGGSLRGLSALTVRSARWLGTAVCAELAGAAAAWLGSGAGYDVGAAVGVLAAAVFCARNVRLPGVVLVLLGIAGNALVVALNGAMPVSSTAAVRAGVDIGAITAGNDPRHTPATATTRLGWLGDVLPVALPWQPAVASPGDVLVAAGLAQLVVTGSLSGGRRRGRSGSSGGELSPDPLDGVLDA